MARLFSKIAVELKPLRDENKVFLRHPGILLSALLLLAAICSASVTYAWISRNYSVNVENVNMRYDVDALQVGGVRIGKDFITLVSTGEATSVSTSDDNLIPGSVLTMKIGIANSGTLAQTVRNIGFQTPIIWTSSSSLYASINKADYDEIPAYTDGRYYYLGTQLTVSVDSYTIYQYKESETEVDESGNPLLEIVYAYEPVSFTPMTPIRMTAVADDGSVDYTSIIREGLSISVPSGHLIAFDVVVTFVESGEEQNVYNNFGSDADGNKTKFFRTLGINIDEE